MQPELPQLPQRTSDGDQILWLTRYPDVRDALVARELVQTGYDAAKEVVFRDVLVTLEGERHHSRRRLELDLVRSESVGLIESRLAAEIAMRCIGPSIENGRGDLVDCMRRFGAEFASLVVGLEDCQSEERLRTLCGLVGPLHAGATVAWSRRPADNVKQEAARAVEAYRQEFFQPARCQRARESIQGGDSLTQTKGGLLRLLAEHGDPYEWTDELMMQESIHYLLASSHSTSVAAIHALDELTKYVSIRLDEREHLTEILFLQQAGYEALRLWPPTGWLYRLAKHDIQLRSGQILFEGSTVGLNLIAANRDPEIFGVDAHTFRPDRQIVAGVPRFGLAFGLGRHVCTGKALVTGSPGQTGSPGVLAVVLRILLENGCRPDPSKTPTFETGTARIQYRTYPILFD